MPVAVSRLLQQMTVMLPAHRRPALVLRSRRKALAGRRSQDRNRKVQAQRTRLAVLQLRVMSPKKPAVMLLLTSWRFPLIDIGVVSAADFFDEQKIIAVEIEDVSNLKLSAGQKVVFGDRGVVIIKGWKLWPDKSTVDLMIDHVAEEILVGDRVYLPNVSKP